MIEKLRKVTQVTSAQCFGSYRIRGKKETYFEGCYRLEQLVVGTQQDPPEALKKLINPMSHPDFLVGGSMPIADRISLHQ
jgi:hypothetical protein